MSESQIWEVLIVEDEYPARMLMIDYILQCPELKLSGIAENGEKALKLLDEKTFDLVFLDINLPGKSGLEVLELAKNQKAKFIFTTAYSEYAVNAFELEAVDYLLKPFAFERFRKAIDKALKISREEKQTGSQSPYLRIIFESATYLLLYSDIQFVSADNKTSVVHTKEKDYQTSRLLKDIEESLPNSQFIRIHRSYLVNIDFIANLRYDKGGAYLVQLKNDDETTLPVGRAFAKQLKDTLGLS